eukprot:1353280-Prymnesium_polylepis.1
MAVAAQTKAADAADLGVCAPVSFSPTLKPRRQRLSRNPFRHPVRRPQRSVRTNRKGRRAGG